MSLNGNDLEYGIPFVEILLLNAESEASSVCFPSPWNKANYDDCAKEYQQRVREADFLRKVLIHLKQLQENELNT